MKLYMNEEKTSLIIGGILSIIIGVVSLMFMIVYSFTQNNDKDYLFILCFGAIGFGVYLLIKAGKKPEV